VQGSSDAQRTPASKVAARPAPPHVLCGCTRYRTLGGRCQRAWPPSHHGVGLVAARLSGGSKFSETSEVASVFIGNNSNHKREGQKGGDYQFPVAPGYEVISWIVHLAFLFTVSQQICLAGRSLLPSDLLKREYIAIVEPVLLLTVMTRYYRLTRLRISLLPSTRIRRDRNPSLGLMAHCPKIKFARDRLSKLLHMGGFSHDALLWNAYSP
jgi:hypothetical protein